MVKIFLLFLIIISSIFFVLRLNTSYTKPFIPYIKAFNLKNNDFKLNTPTLDKIFKDDHTWISTLSAEKKHVLLATGDIIPARAVNYQVVTRNNFLWPYEKTADELKSADLTLINLESPLIPNCPVTQEGMVFCGDQRNIEGLKFAGVDVANLTNNHLGNHGTIGIDETVKILSTAGITSSGLSEPAYKEANNIKFAFLGYNDLDHSREGFGSEYWNKIKNDIQIAKKSADIMVVAFHWGIEYTSQPIQRQKDLAHFAIDSGADLVIGNHPHWIQPVEIYHNKVITYAHGNFIFDQMWSEKTREGVVGRYTFYDKQLIDVEFLPIKIENYGQPYFLEGSEKKTILDNMKSSSLGK